MYQYTVYMSLLDGQLTSSSFCRVSISHDDSSSAPLEAIFLTVVSSHPPLPTVCCLATLPHNNTTRCTQSCLVLFLA